MTHWNKRLLWQHLTTMVIEKIRRMSIKGVKLKSESFFSISPGVLELRRKNLRGGQIPPPPGPDRVKMLLTGMIMIERTDKNSQTLASPIYTKVGC